MRGAQNFFGVALYTFGYLGTYKYSGTLNRGDGVRVISHYFYSVRPSKHLRAGIGSLKRLSRPSHSSNLIGNRLKWALRGAFGSRGNSKIPILKLNLKVKIVADGTKNDILPD